MAVGAAFARSIVASSLAGDFLDLNELLLRGRVSSQPVASGVESDLTWEHLVRRVAGWRAQFEEQPGSRFALYHGDASVFAAALLGGWAAGKVLVLPGDLQALTLEQLSREVDGWAGEFPADLGKPRLTTACQSGAFGDARELDREWVGLVVMTSGSTGRPVLVEKKLAQLLHEIRQLEATFGARLGRARILSTVSHQHIYGLLFRVLWPLSAGRVFESRQLHFPEQVVAHAERTPHAALVTSPAYLKRLPAAPSPGLPACPLRAVFSSGGPLEFGAARLAFESFGRYPTEIYGSSETGGIAYRELESEQVPWRPFPGVELESAPEYGVLRVRSPHLPDEQWFTTADRVRMLANGSFALLGRCDRIAKLEELRVSLDAIEQSLLGCGLVRDARLVVLGRDSRDRAWRRVELGAVVVPSAAGFELLRRSKRALNQALRDAALRSVERVACPRRFRYVDVLPVNAQGKVNEAALVALFQDRAS